MADNDEYEPCETIWEFLQLKGSVGLLTLLNEGPRTFSELESEMEITSTTISRRRIDADDLGLLTVELESGDHGTKHVYTLTDMGERLAKQMVLNEAASNYKEMRRHQRELEAKTEETIAWVRENPGELLQYTEAQEGRVKPNERTGIPSELEEIRSDKEDSDEETDADDSGGENSSTDDANDQEETETSDNSPERAQPPSDKISGDLGGSNMNRTQGTLGNNANDETESK
ncbi:hypothetical protein EXE48_10325 [Halorubrum sp. ASP1]|uniref:hypothetical protein n=1 Tax=Halorubrum sp. ASP1 TaxID=2518114 RepID=UPI0010F9B3AC|nr:hypothetical protein [Halorubrum sp. ASP1]TKX60819.1 hypothetical protein EXE48_10325 [Halorubrum sp. ASP1]